MATNLGEVATTGNVAVKMRSRRQERAQFAQHIQHAVPTVGLLAAAWQSLSTGAEGFELALAVAEIATSVLLIGGILRGVRKLRAKDHGHGHALHAHRIEWLDIFAAGVLLTEAAEHWHLTHRVQGPTLLLASATLAMGLTHGRTKSLFGRARALELTAEHFVIPGKPFRGIKARWSDVKHIKLTDDHAEILLRSGRRRRINLRDLKNAAEVRDLLTQAQQRLEPVPA